MSSAEGSPQEREVGLDDLFGAPRPAGRAGMPVAPAADGRWLLGRLFFAVALAAVSYGLLYLVRLTVPYPLLVVTIFVITVMKHALARIGIRPLPSQLTGRGLQTASTGSAITRDREPDGLGLAVTGWTDQLARAGRDADRYRGTVLPRLRELADERLRLRHGVTRASDPRRAREMMGEHLWRMLHERSSGTPRDMALLVEQIEEL